MPNVAVALPKAPPLAAPALPQAPLLNRPIVVVPVAIVRPPVVVAPTVRPVTLATITRNLQAALAPEAPPVVPTTKGFPGFVSRNFNQVSQHQPGASNEKHLSGLANLFTPPTTTSPERRQAPRPALERPKVTTPQPLPAPALSKKPDPPKAPTLAPKVAQASPKPRAAEQPKPSPAPVKSQAVTTPAAPPAPQPPLARKPETAKVPAPAKPPAPAAAAPTSNPSPTSPSPTRPTPANPVPVPSGAKPAAESKTAPETAPQNELKVEAKPPLLEKQPVRQAEPPKPGQEARNQDRVENPTSLTKAILPSPAGPRPAESEKLAQTRPELSEVKVGEVQRSQVNALQAPGAREQMTLVQENGAGLSAGGGFGSGGGGGQQGRQRRRQDEQDGPEQIGTAEMLGGDEHTEWWLLRGEENLRALSSELREAMFFLRAPQRRLGEDFEQARKRQKAEQQAPKQPVQTEIRGREENQQTGDRVEMEVIELCLTCGNDLGGLDPRRCPACLCQAAQATLELLQADPRFLAYRVFLTACRQPVASQAVYRLRDFASLPSGAYCVQAA